MKMRQALVFGAGAIGLGLLGGVLLRSGYCTKYVDVDDRIVSALHNQRCYSFNVVGPRTKVVEVAHVDAVGYSDRTALDNAVTDADVVFTATTENALPPIAKAIAGGLVKRAKNWRPLNIVSCENLQDTASLLKGYVTRELADTKMDGDSRRVIDDTGFANTIISKMCKKSETPEACSSEPVCEGLDVFVEVEPEGDFMIDQTAMKGEELGFKGPRLLDKARFSAECNRKTFAHNGGHALLAYLGALKGFIYIRESGLDNGIKVVFYRAIGEEMGRSLTSRYPEYFSSSGFGEYVDNIFIRMVSPYLKDTVDRGTRSSIKKISGNDARLTRAARFSVEQGVTPRYFCLTIAAALLLNRIGRSELSDALRNICNLDPIKDFGLMTLISKAYETLTGWQKLNFPDLKQFLDESDYETPLT
jgi:mannitol-1-phosphate 5-dehydrogenase